MCRHVHSLLYAVVFVTVGVAANEAEYDKWVKGLTYLMHDNAQSSYSLMVER